MSAVAGSARDTTNSREKCVGSTSKNDNVELGSIVIAVYVTASWIGATCGSEGITVLRHKCRESMMRGVRGEVRGKGE